MYVGMLCEDYNFTSKDRHHSFNVVWIGNIKYSTHEANYIGSSVRVSSQFVESATSAIRSLRVSADDFLSKAYAGFHALRDQC